MARKIELAFQSGTVSEALVEEVSKLYREELRLHFETEETVLLPALKSRGFVELSEHTMREHQTLHADLDAALKGDLQGFRRFGALLREHIRFEEHEVFPTCEQHLPAEVLEAAATLTRNRR